MMNKDVVYSNSLKRMISFKLFPNINPENIQVRMDKDSKTQNFLKQEKTDRQIKKIKEKLIEQKKHEKSIEEEVDKIIRKMTEDGSADLKNKKLMRKGRMNHFRIISQPEEEPKFMEKIELPVVQNKLPTNPGARVRTENSEKKVRRNLSQRKKTQETEVVNVGRYLRHYREGMSSVKILRHKKQL